VDSRKNSLSQLSSTEQPD